MKDKCVSCGEDTMYDVSTHIDERYGYIEGAGQLCAPCYDSIYSRKHIAIPVSLARTYPNDQELGAAVRILLTN